MFSVLQGKYVEVKRAMPHDAVPDPAIRSREETERKIFVGGLSSETTETDLWKYFGQYGRVLGVQLKKFVNTNQSRRFAFVEFHVSCLSSLVEKFIRGKI